MRLSWTTSGRKDWAVRLFFAATSGRKDRPLRLLLTTSGRKDWPVRLPLTSSGLKGLASVTSVGYKQP